MADQPVQTIRNQVYTILRKALCNGEFTPGQRLQEVELANQLHVSRSPVREALHQLAGDGLVVEVPNKGVYVKEFTLRDIEEIFDVRVMLETYAIRRAVQSMTDSKREILSQIGQKMGDAYARREIDAYVSADTELHNQIISLGSNQLVEDLYYRVRSMNQQFRVLSLNSSKRFQDSISEHQELIDALREGDAERAVRIDSAHLELACLSIKEQLKKQSAQS